MAFPNKAQIKKKKIKSKFKKCFCILLLLVVVVAGVGLLKSNNHQDKNKFMTADASVPNSDIHLDHSHENSKADTGEPHFSIDLKKNELKIGW